MIENLQLTSVQLNNRKHYTRLEPKNKTHSIEEGIQARLKDPLSMLGMQWKMREFRAQNGGKPVGIEMDIKNRVLNNIVRNGNDGVDSTENFDLKIPRNKVMSRLLSSPINANRRINTNNTVKNAVIALNGYKNNKKEKVLMK